MHMFVKSLIENSIKIQVINSVMYKVIYMINNNYIAFFT